MITRTIRKTVGAARPDQLCDRADDRRDHDAFQVEAEDRAPGRVALEDHLLARTEVEAGHRRQHTAASAGAPYRGQVSIAKVEPLTTARALRGPFDYRLPAEMEGLEVGAIVRVPFGHRRILGVVVERAESSELPLERLAEPIEALEAGAPAELVRLGLWIAREYCSTPSRGLELVLPPGTGAGGQRVRSRVELRAEIAPAGEAALSGGERLGVKQRAALEALRGAGEMSAAELAAAVGADRQVLRRLEERGLIATRSSRLRRAPSHRAMGADSGRPRLLPEQEAAAARDRRRDRRGRRRRARAAPARRHRLGQDRGLPGGGRGGARPGPDGDRPRPRDRPRPAGGGALPGPARRPRRGHALGPLRRRALRRVAPAARRRGERLRRAPLGGLRAARRPRPARHRRGARPLLQAGRRPLLRRPRRRPPPGRASAARCWSPARRRRGPRPGSSCRAWSCRAGSTGGRCRRSRSSTCAPPTRARRPPAPGDARGARRGPRAQRQQGDRDDQPARLRALAHLPLLRPSLGLPQLRRLVDRPPPQRAPGLPPLRPLRAAAARLRRVRLDHAGPGRRRHRADRGAARRAPGADAGLPPRLRHDRGARAPTPRSSPASERPTAASSSAPRWSPRGTTSRRSP